MDQKTTKQLLSELETIIQMNPGVSVIDLMDISLDFCYGSPCYVAPRNQKNKLTFSNDQLLYALNKYNRMRKQDACKDGKVPQERG